MIVNKCLEDEHSPDSISFPCITFTFKLLKFIYKKSAFRVNDAFNNFEKLMISDIINESNLITINEAKRRIKFYGECKLEIPKIGFFEFMYDTMTGGFYILQYLSIVLWFAEGLFTFSIILLSITIILTIVLFFLNNSAIDKIKELALHNQKTKVIRKNDQTQQNEEIEIDSFEVVPGDTIIIDQINSASFCDSILINGTVLIDESMLNGESVPIQKSSVNSKEEIFSWKNLSDNIILEGTKILDFKSSTHVKAIVLRTSFSSFKGNLIRDVLFPVSKKDKFFIEILKFVVIYSVIFISLYIPTAIKMNNDGQAVTNIVYRCFDMILWIIPPTLNIYFSICKFIAMIRLRKKGIICLQPEKISAGGEVGICCFDKTGTLTKSEINVHGYYGSEIETTDLITPDKVKLEDRNGLTFKLFATCHAVYKLKDKFVGDSLDLEILRFSGWSYLNPNKDSDKFIMRLNDNLETDLVVKRIFDFNSELQRMGCIVDDIANSKRYLFVKGSPEKLKDFLDFNQTNFRKYKDIMKKMTRKGFRVLSGGYKEISTDIDVNALKLEDIEINLNFLCFIIFHNPLKEDTPVIIDELNEAGLEIKVISGDNPLTTIQTAQTAHILDSIKSVVLVDLSEKSLDNLKIIQTSVIKGEEITDESIRLTRSLTRIESSQITQIENIIKSINENQNELYFAVTGPLISYISSIQVTNENFKKYQELYEKLMRTSQIYARMKPDQKSKIIEYLQSADQVVCMVGDGANDCHALRQADIGLSFSEADASFIAPFSSIENSLKGTIQIFLEGRASEMNNIEIFRYVMGNSFYNYIATFILTYSKCYYSDFHFVYTNFLICVPIYLLIGFSAPSNKLTKIKPPTKLLIAFNVLSIYGQLIIGGAGIILSYFLLLNQNFYTYDSSLDKTPNYRTYGLEVTTVLQISDLFYLFSILGFVTSTPFKERIYKNYPLMIWVSIILIYNSLIIFFPDISITTLSFSTDIPVYFQWYIFAVGYSFGLGMIIYEEIIKYLLIKF